MELYKLPYDKMNKSDVSVWYRKVISIWGTLEAIQHTQRWGMLWIMLSISSIGNENDCTCKEVTKVGRLWGGVMTAAIRLPKTYKTCPIWFESCSFDRAGPSSVSEFIIN